MEARPFSSPGSARPALGKEGNSRPSAGRRMRPSGYMHIFTQRKSLSWFARARTHYGVFCAARYEETPLSPLANPYRANHDLSPQPRAHTRPSICTRLFCFSMQVNLGCRFRSPRRPRGEAGTSLSRGIERWAFPKKKKTRAARQTKAWTDGKPPCIKVGLPVPPRGLPHNISR